MKFKAVYILTVIQLAAAYAAGRDLTGPLLIAKAELVEARQVSTDRRCGPAVGTVCPEGQCCSSGGWCGVGDRFCRAPTCQIDFGPACDANIRPNGPETESVTRPALGSVPYGQAIYDCVVDGVVALTFDDGPWTYTKDLLDILDEYEARVTFFVVGRNLGKGAINDASTPWPDLIRRMDATGHQIASHTWSHQKLTQISEAQFRRQMLYNEVALADLLGRFPTYMRPPHSLSSPTTDAWLGELGYHVIYFDLNTRGYELDSPDLIQGAKDIWDARVEDPETKSVLGIEHDPVFQSVYNLTAYMLDSLQRNGLRAVTVGECLGDAPENWYREVY